MKVCSSQQMRISDEVSIRDYGIPGIVLMENAALGVIKAIKKDIAKGVLPGKGEAVILCGTGNNGGDGFAIARHLISIDWKVSVMIWGDKNKISGDALTNLKIIEKLGITVRLSDETSCFFTDIVKRDLIIDAILGTGFKGELRPSVKAIASFLNSSKANVISVDIPTGLNSDTGFMEEVCIKARKTVTLGLPKIGQVINDGPYYCGELVVEGLSIPKEVYDKVGIERYLINDAFIKEHIKPRKTDSHKGTYGNVFIIAGSKGMAGAGMLSSEAALRGGAGIVKLGVLESLLDVVSGKVPEIITKGFKEDDEGCLSMEAIDEVNEEYKKASVILIGPGLGVGEGASHVLFSLINNSLIPLVVDADGLNILANKPSALLESKGDIVITPHPGEMARLMGISVKDVQSDRLGIAEKFAKLFRVVVVLKGYRSIIATPWGETWINPTGNPGMATAGSGDVLAGIIAAFIAQGFKAHLGAICGAYIHGCSGDKGAEEMGQWGMAATDIIRFIPHTIKEIGGI